MSRTPRLLRLPLVHFLALGGLLYLAREALPAAQEERSTVVISSARVERLRADFERQWGAPPTGTQLRAQVEEAVVDEVLEREARRLALDYGDRAIRQRLVQKMRAVADDPKLGDDELVRRALELGLDDDVVVHRQLQEKMRLLLRNSGGAVTFGDAELRDALERHRDRFLRPATVSFTQLFVRGGEDAEARAAALAARVRTLAPEDAAALSDPFPLAARWNGRTETEIAQRFGGDFAAAVLAAAPGAWSEPLRSPFGLHLVFVRERRAGGLPGVDEVRSQLVQILVEEHAERSLAQGIDRLRALYRVRIEWPEETGS